MPKGVAIARPPAFGQAAGGGVADRRSRQPRRAVGLSRSSPRCRPAQLPAATGAMAGPPAEQRRPPCEKALDGESRGPVDHSAACGAATVASLRCGPGVRRRHRRRWPRGSGEGRTPSAARTTSGVNGGSRNLTPVASKIALAIAAVPGTEADSPAPSGGSSGRAMVITSTTGTSRKLEDRVAAPFAARRCTWVERVHAGAIRAARARRSAARCHGPGGARPSGLIISPASWPTTTRLTCTSPVQAVRLPRPRPRPPRPRRSPGTCCARSAHRHSPGP